MTHKMPIIFAGHGSPMNAIEDSVYSAGWTAMAKEIPLPQAILSISAHWYTNGTRINDSAVPKVIYDMYGFPKELYEIKYNAPGQPDLAKEVGGLLGNASVQTDNSWGIDHGTWSVLHRMYPQANIPVVQLSVDKNASPQAHFEMGAKLRSLRSEGVLIMASGNVVHNLSLVDWDMEGGFPWAMQFDGYIKNNIIAKNFKNVIDYMSAGESARSAFFTPEHFYPLLYVLGSADEFDKVSIWNDSCTMGALSMTSYMFRQ